ncbi:MAG TPA: ATP synthase F1 subunit epsilon [Gemmatimonadaceae bacterium]|nr:ATP synthase F1 subunit epsilon [Gemmatimonadaceae bacterium]
MLKVAVISPERVLFDGEAEAVVAPAFDGEVGILTSHAPMVTLLGRGELRLTTSGGTQRFAVEGGFLQVADDVVRVVTEKAAAAG